MIATDIAVEVMEMVELYCELLLARAAVLDQLAFSDKGIRARQKAKEAIKAMESAGGGKHGSTAASQDGAASASGGGGGGLGLFSRFSRSSTTSQTTLAQKQTEGEQSIDEEEDVYLDPGLDEAAAAIFYSWQRFPREVRELTTLRALLIERWGKDFAALAQENKAAVKVPERLIKRLRVKPPSPELVESYLREIAKAYGVAWPQNEEGINENIPEPVPTPPPEYVDATGQQTTGSSDTVDQKGASEVDELALATPPRDIGPHDASGKSPVSVAPPKPSSDNPNPRVRVPGEEENKASPVRPAQQRKSSTGIPDVDELAKRFAALKR